ncbi:MAG: hypothetical protein IJA75_00740 [Oscillospiraceae bacterium]|nr:hypothetical protein [Oscillospiraceae bacterium]
MATQKEKIGENAAVSTVAAAEDKVEIHVPKGYANDEPNLLICINGVNYLLPRGKTSKVPRAVAEEFYRAQKAQAKLDERVDKLLEASK